MQQKNKVLFVHNSLAEYRIEFWNLLSKLCDLHIITTNNNLEDDIYGLKKGELKVKASQWSKDCLRQVGVYDVVVLPPPDRPKEFCIGLQLIRECKNRKIPTMYWTESWEAEPKYQPFLRKIKNVIHRAMIKSFAENTKICVVAGKKSYDYLLAMGISTKKLIIVYDSSTSPEPIGKMNFKQKHGIKDEQKVVLYLGRLIRCKGIMILLEAFNKAKIKNTVLVIGGSGECEALCRRYVVENNLGDIVIFVGKVQPTERKNYYKRATVFVLPSNMEKGQVDIWGLTLNEALEVGTPVITTLAVGAGYDLITEKTGVVIKEGDIDELVKALKYVCEEKMYDRDEVLYAYEPYDVKHMAKSFACIIQNITKGDF